MTKKTTTTLLAAIATTVAITGCGSSTPASFRNREEVASLVDGVYDAEAKKSIGKVQSKVVETIDQFYGTPQNLVAWERLSVDYGEDGTTLAAGRQLYMQHCMHCHGVTGDGNGPTARYLNPKPRDYRLGKFKFTSTLQPVKPSRADLHHIIRQGIPGTYMPSFLLLEDEELKAITEYVVWLSCRGEMEFKLVDALDDNYDGDFLKEQPKEDQVAAAREFEAFLVSDDEFDGWTATLNDLGNTLKDGWSKPEAEDSIVVPASPQPPITAESIAKGRKLFLNEAKCVNCHGPAGKGDGVQTLAFEDLKPPAVGKRDVPGLHDDWGNLIKPRNLTRGLYRGGRRPIDVFRRIKVGIKGTPMPAASIKDEDIWHVVNFVLNLPHETNGTGVSEEREEPKTAGREVEVDGVRGS